MCYRGLAAANISAASLFRGLEAWTPTLLIDEADTFLQGNDELRGILNSGHTKSTAYVIRTVGDEHEPKLFPTFAPIAIGMIKRPPDTLLDRSLVIRLQRKLGTDPVTPLPLEVEDEYLPIRQKCLRWAEDNRDDLEGNRELTPADIGNDRARDNWIPLTAIAQQCGVLPEAQAACRHLTLQEDESLTVILLEDIQQIFREDGKDKLPSKVLVKKLIAMEERPWAEYRRGKELTQNQLARMLKDFDVHTHQAKVGTKNLKHYRLEDLEPRFERYLKKVSAPVREDTTATSLPVGKSPCRSEASEVSDDVAVAASPPENSAAPATQAEISPMPDAEAADDKTLPLPDNAVSDHAEQGVTAGSGVAVKNRGKTFSFSRSSSQGGD
jgi:putative DNA primase/helicase